MTFIVPQQDATDAQQVGGKAAALGRLAQAGFAPPEFFVIRAEAFDGETFGGETFKKGGAVPGLATALARLGDGPFAVRSSARAEDGAEHSHAGQFDSFLNVPAAEVEATARRVWQSGFSETVATYRARWSGGQAEGPAVVVQRMVDARVAGVAFSADPVTGRRDRVVISAIAGLADRLVSGEADGEDWTVAADTGTDTGAVCATRPVVLTEAQAQEIADLARRAEALFGSPQDIEWALDDAGLHILQSRPITTAIRAAPNPDDALTIFDNSNIIESYPGVVSPLTYSFAVHVYGRVYRVFVAMLGVPQDRIAAHSAVFDNMLGRVDGRVYYNLVNWYRALSLLPGFSLNRAYMETMMGVDTPMPAEVTDRIGPPSATGRARLSEYGRLVRAGAGLLWQALVLPRTRRRFYDRLNAALDSDLDLDRAGPTALAAEYRKIESTLLDRWDAPLVNDFLCMIAFGASRNLMQKWLGQDGIALHNDVMIGQGDIVSAEPARRILAMGQMAKAAGLEARLAAGDRAALAADPRLQHEFDAYIARFGDRCTEELKLESLTLRDDPSSLLAAIAASAGRDMDKAPPDSAPDWAALFPNPLKRAAARALIGWAKARVRDRENLRFERTRVFGHARRVFLALGREFAARGLIDAPRDVFHLTTLEVLGAVEGFGLSPDLRSLIALRKAEDSGASQRPDPPERIELRGPAISPVWNDSPAARDGATRRTATGCSAGRVSGVARVIRDPRTQSLAPGEILVARHTDPGWIAVFSNAAAIVVERGSLLSHSAIVARELGIPCVVGLRGATGWIEDGESITVDGATGEVERHGSTRRDRSQGEL
ncbi:PEP/pyruvate-binding domain-containing protein [Halodurantibacterium flavum]|uniref:PEP/pyruvate-binding domain-containing protein n=1 Tax=Halodurantibacterium flavum TaxID=1382802 RepID=A0ABW4S2Y2_9RHOB